jgi:hypothetical protein
MDKSKFDFYEEVKITSTLPSKQEVSGEVSAVLGKAQNDNGDWSYAVWVYRDSICWSMDEHELESTGEFDKEETFYSGNSVRVRVDEHVRGTIIND